MFENDNKKTERERIGKGEEASAVFSLMPPRKRPTTKDDDEEAEDPPDQGIDGISGDV
jgi:hypothetical protein